MQLSLKLMAITLMVAYIAIKPSYQLTECEEKRAKAEKLVRDQESTGAGSHLAIVVPNCTPEGEYASLQCHHGSNFCQCWDKDGGSLTQPKKNLKKCTCLVDRAKQMKSIPPSQTDIPELTSCETDGNYTAKQCNRTACWCVNPNTGKKIGNESNNKSTVKC